MRVLDEFCRFAADMEKETEEGEPMKCLSNMPKSDRNFVLGAIEASGLDIEWRDAPDHRMDDWPEAKDWGSVWSPLLDATVFWREFEIRKYGKPLTPDSPSMRPQEAVDAGKPQEG